MMELAREGPEAGLGWHELVLLARDSPELEARIWFESRGPVLSERCNELAAARHVPQLSLPERQPGCLAEPCTRRAEQDHLLRATSSASSREWGGRDRRTIRRSSRAETWLRSPGYRCPNLQQQCRASLVGDPSYHRGRPKSRVEKLPHARNRAGCGSR